MLDDSISWLAPGQLRRLGLTEAMQHLRADLLPPVTPGAPVTPLTAYAGLPVQLAAWPWTPPHVGPSAGTLSMGAGAPTSVTEGSEGGEGATAKPMLQVDEGGVGLCQHLRDNQLLWDLNDAVRQLCTAKTFALAQSSRVLSGHCHVHEQSNPSHPAVVLSWQLNILCLPLPSSPQVIGSLVEPASPDGLSWHVQWPDGVVRIHSTGEDGRFELVHLQVGVGGRVVEWHSARHETWHPCHVM
jgi:hypothetical protein